MEPVMLPEEVAEVLRVSVYRVYQLHRAKMLPGVRLGRQLRFNRAAVEAFVSSGGAALPGPGGWRREEPPSAEVAR